MSCHLLYQKQKYLLFYNVSYFLFLSNTDTTKISGPAQADAYYYTPAFFTDKYSASQVRMEVGVAVENVILGDQEPEVALENLLNLFK